MLRDIDTVEVAVGTLRLWRARAKRMASEARSAREQLAGLRPASEEDMERVIEGRAMCIGVEDSAGRVQRAIEQILGDADAGD